MTALRALVQAAADAFGAALGPLLIGAAVLSAVVIAFEAAVRWRARS